MFASENVQNSQVPNQSKDIAPIPFNIDGPPSIGGHHNNDNNYEQSSTGGNSFYPNSESKAGQSRGQLSLKMYEKDFTIKKKKSQKDSEFKVNRGSMTVISGGNATII